MPLNPPPSDSVSSMLPNEHRLQRKRRRDQSAREREDIEEQPSTKRRRAASYEYPAEFWNALSKITLTRRALKEFDRRTAIEKASPEVGVATRSTRLLRSDTKKLLRFAKSGATNLEHLRGYADLLQPVADMSQSSSRKSKRTRGSALPSSGLLKSTSTSTTGPYNSQFQQMLTERGVFPDGYEDSDGNPQEPANIDSIRELLAINRSSLSPPHFTNDAFKHFQRANRKAKSESKAMSSVIPIITGAKDNRFESEENTMFNNIEKFAPGLKMAQPDKYYGARPEQVDPRVLQDLGKRIIPSTSTFLPVVPNFFFEGKGAAGRPDVAQRQVMHDNAYGARAMLELQNYGKETPVYDGSAYTIGSSYHPGTGTLQMYSTHPRQSPTGGTEYYMTQLDSYGMTGNIETFRRGAAAYRNARDLAKQQRDRLIAEANAIARSASTDVSSSKTDSRTGASFTMANNSFGSDTSADELALNHGPSSDESDGKAHPRKRLIQEASTGLRPRSSTHVPTPNAQASNQKLSGNQRRARNCATKNSNNGDDEEHVTADGEQDEDEDEDIHTAIHGRQTPDEAALALQSALSAQNAMARLLKRGHSKEAALRRLIVAHQRSKRVSRLVATSEVRAMLAVR